jgi:hypothetical protein
LLIACAVKSALQCQRDVADFWPIRMEKHWNSIVSSKLICGIDGAVCGESYADEKIGATLKKWKLPQICARFESGDGHGF